MKKIFTLLIVAITIFSFAACSKPDEKDIVESNLAFYHDEFYCGQDEQFAVKLECGMRETEFKTEGEIEELSPFCTLVLIPKQYELRHKDYNYSLKGANGTLEGSFEIGNISRDFIADLVGIDNLGVIESVTINAVDVSATIPLSDKLEGSIDWKQALDIARENFGANISAEIENDNFDRRIFVKYINDSKNVESSYYWYVVMANSDEDYWSILLSPTDGTVITKKGANAG